MNDRFNLLASILVIIVLVLWIWTRSPSLPEPIAPERPVLRSLEEIQIIIGAEPDGEYGPETKRLWERYIHNQHAAEYMTLSGAPKEAE